MGWTFYNSSGQRLSSAAASSAVVRSGGEATEDTFTNTSAADLIDVSSLSIGATAPFLLMMSARKDATGSGNHINIGLKINSTIIGDATIGNNNVWMTTNTDEIQEGVSFVYVGPRATNYQNSGLGLMTIWSSTTRRSSLDCEDVGGQDNQYPIATVTNVILRSITNDPVGGVDEFNVYTYSTG